MNTNRNTLVIVGSLVALLTMLANVRFPFSFATLIAYGAVAALGLLVAIEYRVNWKRLFNR
jgi:multisubunit Na+/H+ antiporter MnhG subunit